MGPSVDGPEAQTSLEAGLYGLVAVLLRDHPPLERAQDTQTHRADKRECENEVHPDRRVKIKFEQHEQDHAHHADNRHDEEGRTIGRISEAVAEFALRAFFADRQIALQQRAFAATRASAVNAGFKGAEGRILGF